MQVIKWAERPDLADRGPASSTIWPEYNLHGDVFEDWWLPLLDELPEYQFALYDEVNDVVLAEGHTGPLAWDGDDATLSDGIDDALRRVVTERRTGQSVDTLCAFAAEVPPDQRGRGLAAELLKAMAEIARRNGLSRLIAPVRPSLKEHYPLTPIERYITWRDPEGQLRDPWMRLHERVGARVGAPLPRSMRITGSVQEWESWTGLAFPDSGEYTFPRGLAPLTIDRAGNRGAYWEPNFWMIHPELG